MLADLIFVNGRVWTGEPDGKGQVKLQEDCAIATRSGRIIHAGPRKSAPEARKTIDLEGRLVTPGLIDCHTHIVHAGNRANEWQMRLEGASYEEVARAGGGIVSTVKAVRKASEDELVAASLPRLDALIAEGVTTIEVKSGYGLDAENEAKMLRAARRLERTRAITVRTAHLGAHAMPPGAKDKDAYITDVIERQLPLAVGEALVDAVDAFCEGIAFSPEQVARVFDAAHAQGIRVKIHAEQLSNLGGAKLAAKYGALSADHIEYLDSAGIKAMAKAGTVGVLLPGAYYFIKEKRKPPVAALRKAGVPMAVATDCNPGSSPLTSLLLAMNMACTFFGLTPEEALAGVTRHAARALDVLHESGTIAPAKWCDLAIWDVAAPAELSYRIGFNPLWMRVWRGHV
jgi:imidazolonepropionase